jgi:ABC-type methionine transport system ATPase subunit
VTTLRARLRFPESLVREPVVAELVRDHQVLVNIRRADVSEREGWIVCELAGEDTAVDAAVRWLTERGVEVSLLGDVVES